ncbi:serine/arginine repetitive matrix protein 1-like [Schistocerca piceifrons]|uniref:serine/arginine repetitive matrix protein 1-like n=1 Tax=Schistocerca piceifrons TaxID=274613 RepID=UPI001F5E3CAF|nr:serine/arginine repetitive matrix protein 1-like [Schistocerca piceifrons]
MRNLVSASLKAVSTSGPAVAVCHHAAPRRHPPPPPLPLAMGAGGCTETFDTWGNACVLLARPQTRRRPQESLCLRVAVSAPAAQRSAEGPSVSPRRRPVPSAASAGRERGWRVGGRSARQPGSYWRRRRRRRPGRPAVPGQQRSQPARPPPASSARTYGAHRPASRRRWQHADRRATAAPRRCTAAAAAIRGGRQPVEAAKGSVPPSPSPPP